MIDTKGASPGNAPLTAEQLAHLGGGHIAYVKPMRSEEARQLFPQVQGIPAGLQLFALLSADGTPILLTDSRDAAVANAWEHELQTVSVH
jgi:hypothetical protein